MEVDPRTNALLDYTNDLCRLAAKAQNSGLLEEELCRLQKDLDAIRRLATTTTTSTSSTCLPWPSSLPDGSSPPATLGLLASSLAMVDHYRHNNNNNTHHQRSSALSAKSFFRPSSMFTNVSSPPRGNDQHSYFIVGNTSAGKTTPNDSNANNDNNSNSNSKAPVGIIKRRNRGKNLPKDIKRRCTICKVEKTSQWRSGADGRPTLCNACGLRYRHSMKQHRQYLEGNKQLSVGQATSKDTHRNSERGGESFPELPELQRQELFEALRTHQEQLRQQRQLDLVDSADIIDECHSPLAEEHSSTRRSSIYSLLN